MEIGAPIDRGSTSFEFLRLTSLVSCVSDLFYFWPSVIGILGLQTTQLAAHSFLYNKEITNGLLAEFFTGSL